uniref:Retrovirus-related Pol polyprotein from transposon TNT 1-94 n=1 Tax=Nicotiana tabacum TaxID=4097 RepID=A0A1S4C7E1_TOBAC|nr:PREDICTED: uncharacterized protein LOC107816019 [Nicotiana tabacum]
MRMVGNLSDSAETDVESQLWYRRSGYGAADVKSSGQKTGKRLRHMISRGIKGYQLGYKFVIAEECPEKPENATDNQLKAYDKWVKADEMARCYILASMENVLQYQHQSMGSSYDMLENLKEMFGEQNRAAKQTAMKALLNTKMAEGSSVRDHVLKMMSRLNELEVFGAVIDKESQVEMVLQTLPNSFQQFRLNYNMNKMDLSLAKLLNKLQAA